MTREVFDIVIVGAGIVGLWIAKFACDRGLKVGLVDKGRCGSGGSGGLLGALLPHTPLGMNAKKRFQFDALVELPELIGAVEEQTGHNVHYRRCGRIMPIRLQSFLDTTRKNSEAARREWQGPDQSFEIDVLDSQSLGDWIDPREAPLGLFWENLSAKVSPRDLIAALRTYVARDARLFEGFTFQDFDSETGKVGSREGRFDISTDKLIVSAGFQSFEILQSLGLDIRGDGIKGQAALYKISKPVSKLPEECPIILDDGTYVVPQANSLLAVGSTSERQWTSEHATEPEKFEATIKRARELCPPLRNTELAELWSGIRPRSQAKDPVVGSLCPNNRIYVATGGYKISFGIAHRLARALIDEIAAGTSEIELPETYHPQTKPVN